MVPNKSERSTLRNTSDTSTYRRTVSSDTLIGDKVKNREGDTIGTLREIRIDVQRGQVAYGVLETGNFLGMGSKLLAIPFGAFTVTENGHVPILDIDEEVLRSAEGFDQNSQPDFTSQEWNRKTHSHYGYEPYFNRYQEGTNDSSK